MGFGLPSKYLTIQLPSGGEADTPKLKQMPKMPIASPSLPGGTMSATYAEVPVGLKPVLNP